MNSNYDLANGKGHGSRGWAHAGRYHVRSRRLIVLAVSVFAATGVAYSAVAASPPPSHRPATPNQCIALNGGDYNACNVGNSGRGDLPYAPVTYAGLRPPTADRGYKCLRDTGGQNGQCNTAEGLPPYLPSGK
jgi:hypothetical protein